MTEPKAVDEIDAQADAWGVSRDELRAFVVRQHGDAYDKLIARAADRASEAALNAVLKSRAG